MYINQILIIIMKTNAVQCNKNQKAKGKTPVSQQIPRQEQTNRETIMMFGFEQYPFPNQICEGTPLLKTIVNLDLNTQKLQKVIKLAHPNVIGLRKIVRSSPRQGAPGRQQSYYSFYYEMVEYNIKELVEDPTINFSLAQEAIKLNFKGILMALTSYLTEAAIYYLPRLEDIGIQKDGTIKIYIPPNIVLDSAYNPAIHRSILALGDWWEGIQNHFACSKFKKEKTGFNLQPPRLSDNGDLQLQDPSMKSSTLQRQLGQLLEDDDYQQRNQQQQLKQSLNSHYSKLSKLGSSQKQQFQKFDEQIKFLRSRLKDHTKRKPQVIQKKQPSIFKPINSLFDSHQIPTLKESVKKSDKNELSFPRQPIQQNIHCINIYNNPPPTPYSPPINHQKSKPYPNYYEANLDPEFFGDQDEEYSQDTYDIQFENQFEGVSPNNYRNTLFSQAERDGSQYSQHCRKKNKDGWGEKRVKQQLVQVCSKNVTESAGPLQFKSFVNKIIKPQFLAKKSNIYQQPNQDGQDSERDGRTRWKQQQTLRRSAKNTPFRPFSVEKGPTDSRRLQRMNQTQEQHPHQIKRISSQHQFGVKTKQGPEDNQIQQRVRRALQKTKNAIALLNRVKSNKSMLRNISQQDS